MKEYDSQPLLHQSAIKAINKSLNIQFINIFCQQEVMTMKL